MSQERELRLEGGPGHPAHKPRAFLTKVGAGEGQVEEGQNSACGPDMACVMASYDRLV